MERLWWLVIFGEIKRFPWTSVCKCPTASLTMPSIATLTRHAVQYFVRISFYLVIYLLKIALLLWCFFLLFFFVYIHTYLYILYLCVFHFQLFCSGILIASLKHRLATGMLVCIHPCKYFMLSLIEGCRSDVLMFYILLITVVYIYRQIVYVWYYKWWL